MSDPTPSEPVVETPRRTRISAAWLVPLAALGIAIGVAWNSYSDRGPLIEVFFDSGEGITAGETRVKYKNFDIGLVERLEFTEDLRQVVAEIRLDAEIADYIDESTQFWLVQAQVGPQGISGLQTVLSGAYIATAFDTERGPRQTQFTALTEPPLTPAGTAGTRVILRAPQGGSISVGAPVLFKRIEVGTVEKVDLSEAGDVVITAFIDAPNDDRLTTATRFWNASGFAVNLSSAGASLDVESLAALVRGGVAFDTVTSGGEPVESSHEFRLFADEQEARVVILNEDPRNVVRVMTSFQSSVRGLQVGAAVQYRGIPVGEVSEIQAEVVRVDGEPVVSVRGTLTLNPSRFGIPPGGDPRAQLLDLLGAGVENGLRARLSTANILTGTLIVELVDVPEAEPATFQRDALPYPELPSTDAGGDSLAATAEGLLARFDSLPIEELMNSVTTLMASANRLLTEPALQEAPANIGALIADLRTLVESDGLREAPAELGAILASARRVVDEISEQQVAENLTDALQAAADAARNVEGATQNLPGLIDQISGVAEELRGLPLQDTVAAATRLIDDIGAIVNSEGVQAVPASVDATLAEARALLQDVREGGAIEDIDATAAAIRSVADELVAARITDQITTILTEVRTASTEFPSLVDNLDRVSANVAALPLDGLVSRAEEILASVEALIQSEGVAGLPPRVSAAVDDLRLIISDFVAGGAVENINATLVSTREIAEQIAAAELAETITRVAAQAEAAAGDVSTASQDLPELMDNLTRLSEKADALPLDELVRSATRVLDDADAFLSSEGVASVPPELSATLAELRLSLEELREGGAVNNLNATLASADQAAEAITRAADELPALVAELSRVATQAEATLGTLGPGSEINRDTLLLLRDVRNAAQSVNALVTALERRPNSILFGR